jgi:hypothetical protein
MGFCDLTCFNKALLTKQLWTLVQNPKGLTARVLKAKYYPNGGLLEANLGSRPSLAWRSILSAKDLFQVAICLRIGDGNTAKVWSDK